MKKISSYIITVLLLFGMMALPVTADETEALICETAQMTYDLLTVEDYVVNDKYAMDRSTGDIYYFPDYDTVFKDGITDDKRAYDADGKWISFVTYMTEKYAKQRDSGSITFRDYDEMDFYISCVNVTEGNAQNRSYLYNKSGAHTVLSSNELMQAIGGMPTQEYRSFIDRLVSSIDSSLSSGERISAALSKVYDLITYDKEYTEATLEEAVLSGRGVCYHYIRVLEDVLTGLDIRSEAILGNFHSFGTNHVWLRAWDDEGGCWIYCDPTHPAYPGDCGTINIERYFSNYTSAGVSQ